MKQEKYALSNEEYAICVRNTETKLLRNAKSAKKQPQAIFVASQPGAGKTVLINYLIDKFVRENGDEIVSIDADEVSKQHKYYDKIMIECSEIDSYDTLQELVKPILDRYLRHKVTSLQISMVSEGTFSRPDSYFSIMRFHKDGGELIQTEEDIEKGFENVTASGGYKVLIIVLALNRYESLLSCLEREKSFIRNNLPIRTIPFERHDFAYDFMLASIQALRETEVCDEVMMYRRGKGKDTEPEVLGVFDADANYSELYQCLENERNMQINELLQNPNEFLDKINELKKFSIDNADNDFVKDVFVNKIRILESNFKEKLLSFKSDKYTDRDDK